MNWPDNMLHPRIKSSAPEPTPNLDLYAFAFGKWQEVIPIATSGPMLKVATKENSETTVVGCCQCSNAEKFRKVWKKLAGPSDQFAWEDGTPYEL